MIRILTVGKKPPQWLKAALERYQQRLRAPFDVSWQFLAHSVEGSLKAVEKESAQILAKIQTHDFVILLDERGQNISSPKLSQLLEQKLSSSKTITLVIGGAYGVNQALRQRADFVWSLSNLVFPHQLVRLIVLEQIYRAQTIAQNQNYHHQ